MKNIFIVPGYGIPKDILKDESYKRYLGLVFNHIFEVCTKIDNWRPIIIFCGGPTDIFKPYKRIESQEMKKLFLEYARRNFVKNYTKNWCYKTENKSLSTVENLLFAKSIISKIKDKGKIYIFCEYTRQLKLKTFAKKIFTDKFLIIPLDFDLSTSRYHNPEFIKKKENMEIKSGLLAIRDKIFRVKYRKTFIEKLAYFRKMGPARHGESINIWWQKKIKELEMGS
jgi:hypothetical protein